MQIRFEEGEDSSHNSGTASCSVWLTGESRYSMQVRGRPPFYFVTLSSPGVPFISLRVEDVEIIMNKVRAYGAALKR